jgi:hypothetical protein
MMLATVQDPSHSCTCLVSDAGPRHLLDAHILLAQPLECVHLGIWVVLGSHGGHNCTVHCQQTRGGGQPVGHA